MHWGFDGTTSCNSFSNWYGQSHRLYNNAAHRDNNVSHSHSSTSWSSPVTKTKDICYMKECSRARPDYFVVPPQHPCSRKPQMNLTKSQTNNMTMPRQVLSETTNLINNSQVNHQVPVKGMLQQMPVEGLRDASWLFSPNSLCWPQPCDPLHPGLRREVDDDTKGKTTMMLRNIPNKYTQKMLLEYLESNGFRGTFDFFYLPIDFRNRCNVGYAFVNFIAPEHAKRFLKALNRVKLPAYNSSKVCEVTYAHVQGLEQNIEHYRNSPVNGVPIAAYRPLIFKSGMEVGFPKPDAPLPPIQLRPAKC